MRILLIFLMLFNTAFCFSQTSNRDIAYPEIGKEIPDFLIDTIFNYSRDRISKEDLKGQYYILDFWSSGCLACINSFPKVNRLQAKYKGKLKMFLIGRPDSIINRLYRKLAAKYNLDLTVGYSRKVIDNFCPMGFPHLIWVDMNGTIRAISKSEDLNERNLNSFLSDKNFLFTDVSNKAWSNRGNVFDPTKPFLVNGNGGADTSFLFRSILSAWTTGMKQYYQGDPVMIDKIDKGSRAYGAKRTYQGLKLKLGSLFNLAYHGEFFPHEDSIYYFPVLEVEDTSPFKIDSLTGEGYYNYSVTIPTKMFTSENVMRIMRKDLESYFPYRANFEKRVMPCYSLVVSDSAKLINLQGDGSNEFVSSYILKVYNNYTTSKLAKSLAAKLPNKFRIFDETNISYPVSVKINALMTDIEQIRSELQRYGLDIVLSKRLMTVLVISDQSF